MKLTNDQFEALAYIFERENGNEKSDYEKELITESGLDDFEPEFWKEMLFADLKMEFMTIRLTE